MPAAEYYQQSLLVVSESCQAVPSLVLFLYYSAKPCESRVAFPGLKCTHTTHSPHSLTYVVKHAAVSAANVHRIQALAL